MSLRRRWLAWRESRAAARRPIPNDLWKRTLIRYPFLQRRDAALQAELRRLTSLFLDSKEFTATGGLRLRNDVVVAIAAQACLPVLRLGLARYSGFVGIVVHPDQVLARREVSDDDGIVHAYDEVLSGEAMRIRVLSVANILLRVFSWLAPRFSDFHSWSGWCGRMADVLEPMPVGASCGIATIE